MILKLSGIVRITGGKQIAKIYTFRNRKGKGRNTHQ